MVRKTQSGEYLPQSTLILDYYGKFGRAQGPSLNTRPVLLHPNNGLHTLHQSNVQLDSALIPYSTRILGIHVSIQYTQSSVLNVLESVYDTVLNVPDMTYVKLYRIPFGTVLPNNIQPIKEYTFSASSFKTTQYEGNVFDFEVDGTPQSIVTGENTTGFQTSSYIIIDDIETETLLNANDLLYVAVNTSTTGNELNVPGGKISVHLM